MVSANVQLILNRLVEIGHTEEFDQLDDLPAVRDFSSFWIFACSEHELIVHFAEQLSQADLVAFVKALTVAEDQAGGGYSSVSPVVDLYPRINDPDRVVADWILRHTHNEYLPFGGGRLRWNRGARSIAEYDQTIRGIAEDREAGLNKERERQERDKARIVRAATTKLFGAVQRGDIKAVAALIKKGADITANNSEGPMCQYDMRHLSLTN